MTFFLLLVCFGFLILFPSTSFEGAKNGLLLWFQIVLPTLFPFLVITNLMESLLPIASGRVYALFTGFLSGYPIGAKSCNYIVSQGKSTKKEGQFLLSFCNNASPAFLLNYVFIRCLSMVQHRFLLLLILYLSSFLGALFFFPKQSSYETIKKSKKDYRIPSTSISFDTIIMASFEIITKIGGYIILFSLLATIIKVHFPLPVLTKTILCGILEITTGMNLLFESMYSSSTKLLIGMFIASFGGLSALFQTKSVIKESGLSIRSYTFAKVCSSLLCVCFTKILLLFNIL